MSNKQLNQNQFSAETTDEQGVVNTKSNRTQTGVYILLCAAVVLGAIIVGAGFMYQTHVLSKKIADIEAKLAQAVAEANGQQRPTDPLSLFKDAPEQKLALTGDPAAFIGNPYAPVHIIAYEDFQCPFCKQFFLTTYPSLKTNYIDTGKIKFTPRNYPFLGDESVLAAKAAKCAQKENRLWELRDVLYNKQAPENSGTLSVDSLTLLASNIGINQGAFKQCVESQDIATTIIEEIAEAEQNGVNATPTFFINDKKIEGALEYEELTSILDFVLNGQ
jgi:protein-disulfide isomerase